ncbi:ATP-dependent DNA helicase PcrA [Jeotgalicoccus coquinae]|uniref:ATP-dependent DNA helicase n=1 Tax=Jeotgalicoccus coquinae TaxID=709509 RepID=A0A6V7RRI6_9STAP|nr:DNA helicase PcrA [Jeotgalicoccus coquinae]MBB6424152.1 DNA helicase-2/ATP-dependent DNA helicase PcrA [Jeotgalicoccus coquinae]GGE26079.1 ATP-dependent DNA helicase PcrA [Jeotgalicoccus coquinae]CAD2081419.1 ATP-dependent DNA helicase PcrA [Jeotgalicoccus coquinae]
MDLSTMNKEQLEAIKATEGPLLIMAGAGSGKTRVLTHRVAYLLDEKQVPSYNILAITFTNKAAKEMRERVDKLISEDAAKMWISTFHAMCVRILRRDISYLGYDTSFSILDPLDQQSVVRDILKTRNLDTKQHNPRSILAVISNYKNQLIKPEQAVAEAAGFQDELYSEIYKDYQEILYRNSSLDFDDLIMLTIELFNRKPDVLNYYQTRFQYVHVDEYQDTNHAQYQLVQMLAAKYRNICVVGDSDQSIYKFRGADIQNILNFEEDYPEARVIKLEENYRSTKTILDAANAVIDNNTERKPKNLRSNKGDGVKIDVNVSFSEREEGQRVVQKVQELSDKYSYGDMAVLYRANAQSRAVEDAFVKSSIPYKMVGGTKFYSRMEIKDLMSYLKVIQNPFDDISFQRIINVPKRGIGAKTIDKLRAHAEQLNSSIYDAIRDADFLGIPAKTVGKLMSLLQVLDNLKEKSKYLTMTELVDEVLADTGYHDMLSSDKTLEARSRLENLEEFKTVTREFDNDNPIADDNLFNFLSDMALVSDQDGMDDNSGVTMMTMHASKGLEFPVIFVVGLEEGIFPSRRVQFDDQELEEERRLMYVALTRAMDHLILSRAESRMLYGKTETNMQSRFLSEIPEELLESAGTMAAGFSGGSGVTTGTGSSFARGPKKRSRIINTNKTGTAFNVGDKVSHKAFGEGIISQVKGEGDNTELDIVFKTAGPKRLLANYAPLEKKD